MENKNMNLPFTKEMYHLFKNSLLKSSGFHKDMRMYPIEIPVASPTPSPEF